MTHAEIAANARKPYAEVIIKLIHERDRYRDALQHIADYRLSGDVSVAQLIARAAIELREPVTVADEGPKFLYDECVGYANDQRALMVADRQAEMAADAQFDPRGE